VAVYVRADLEHVTVLHLGLSEEYCAGGEREGWNLLLRFMKEIRPLVEAHEGSPPPERALRTQRTRAQA